MNKFKYAMFTILGLFFMTISRICEIVLFLGIPTQLALVIIKFCGVASFLEVMWNDVLLWIPLICSAVAIPVGFLFAAAGMITIGFTDYIVMEGK